MARSERGVQLAEVHTTPSWIGHKISTLQEETGSVSPSSPGWARPYCRGSQTVLQEGDLVHVMMRTDEIAKVEEAFAQGPEEDGH